MWFKEFHHGTLIWWKKINTSSGSLYLGFGSKSHKSLIARSRKISKRARSMFRIFRLFLNSSRGVPISSLQWPHNEGDSVSNHRHLDCLLKRLFGRRPNTASKVRVTGLCEANSPHKGPATPKMFPFIDFIMLSDRVPSCFVGNPTCFTDVNYVVLATCRIMGKLHRMLWENSYFTFLFRCLLYM